MVNERATVPCSGGDGFQDGRRAPQRGVLGHPVEEADQSPNLRFGQLTVRDSEVTHDEPPDRGPGPAPRAGSHVFRLPEKCPADLQIRGQVDGDDPCRSAAVNLPSHGVILSGFMGDDRVSQRRPARPNHHRFRPPRRSSEKFANGPVPRRGRFSKMAPYATGNRALPAPSGQSPVRTELRSVCQGSAPYGSGRSPARMMPSKMADWVEVRGG
jgi:hypothetical protein